MLGLWEEPEEAERYYDEIRRRVANRYSSRYLDEEPDEATLYLDDENEMR